MFAKQTVLAIGLLAVAGQCPGQAPKSQPKPVKLYQGQIIRLRCENPVGVRFWLRGVSDEGSVSLSAKAEGVPGTRWRVHLADEVVFLECLDDLRQPRLLDGNTTDGRVTLVKEASKRTTGTQWATVPMTGGAVQLKCLGINDGFRWLTADTESRTVRLGKQAEKSEPTRWQVEVAKGK